MSFSTVGVILLFAAFCLCQLVFNILWKVVDIKLSVIQTEKQLDAAYLYIVKKILRKGDPEHDM